MSKIDSLVLRCSDPDLQRQFYCHVLGMQEFSDGSVGYGAEQATIQFSLAEGQYNPEPNDLYWKIALAVPNIDLACEQLIAKGVQPGIPRQFQDIGFLAHFTDPEGFTIELIEHWFQGGRPDKPVNTELLGGGAHFNLVTLRTDDIQAAREFCNRYGMTLLSIQAVENYGFTLYFFAFTDDIPPSADLQAIENREWLYQRSYTILEIQHLQNESRITPPDDVSPGYAGIVFSGFSSTGIQPNALRINTVSTA